QLWVTNGDVVSMAATQSTVYVGGDFTLIGRRTGSWASVAPDGSARAPREQVHGSVTTAVPDGAGGWFVRGEIESVGPVAPRGIAHLRAGGRLDRSFRVKINGGNVVALARSGTTLYLG